MQFRGKRSPRGTNFHPFSETSLFSSGIRSAFRIFCIHYYQISMKLDNEFSLGIFTTPPSPLIHQSTEGESEENRKCIPRIELSSNLYDFLDNYDPFRFFSKSIRERRLRPCRSSILPGDGYESPSASSSLVTLLFPHYSRR